MEPRPDNLNAPGNLTGIPVATALPQPDHERVDALFAAHDKQQTPSRKKQFVAELRTQLSALVQAEEEVFYPALSAGAGGR